MIILKSLDAYVMHTIYNDKKINLVLGVASVCSLVILIDKKGGGFMMLQMVIFLLVGISCFVKIVPFLKEPYRPSFSK